MRFISITVATLVALSLAPAIAAPKPGETSGTRPGAAQQSPSGGNQAAPTRALPVVAPPPRATTPIEKIERLRLSGVFATVAQLGTSYRLDMLRPVTSSASNPRGFLKLLMATTIHLQGGFADFGVRHTITDSGSPYVVLPNVQIRLLFDATRVQLIDCQVGPDGTQLEFEHAYTSGWQNKATVTAAAGHVFYVIPAGTPTHYSDVRLQAAPTATVQTWRLFGCEITPVG